MKRSIGFLLSIMIGTMLIGCATTRSSIAENETMLAAAGFRLKPADTPERMANLQALPPNKLFTKTKDSVVYFLYADPKVCQCIYIGDQQAYQKYQKMAYDKQLAETQRMTAEANENAAMNWGLWGPFWW